MDIGDALEKAHNEYAKANPRSASAHHLAARYLPGGNTRSTLYFAPFPLTMIGGKGAILTDLDDHDYADFMGEYTSAVFGHSDDTIREALAEASAGGLSLGAHNVWEVRLAQALCERFPAIELVRFANSGTEANLFALAAARNHSKRGGIVGFRGGYHGGVVNFARADNPTNVPHKFLLADYNDVAGTHALLREYSGAVGTVIVEPMMSSAGCIPADRAFLEMLRETTARLDIVLIFDEVVTSRLAPRGVHDELGITPDLVTLGKWIGGGLNIGAFGGRGDIMAQFDPRNSASLPHGGTFNNNVLTMRTGHAAVTEVYGLEASRRLNAKGTEFRASLNEIAAQSQLPLQFTGLGAATNVHMVRGEIRNHSDAQRGNMKLRELYYFHLLSRGIYLASRAMMNLSLPMTDANVKMPIEATKEFVETYGSLSL